MEKDKEIRDRATAEEMRKNEEKATEKLGETSKWRLSEENLGEESGQTIPEGKRR